MLIASVEHVVDLPVRYLPQLKAVAGVCILQSTFQTLLDQQDSIGKYSLTTHDGVQWCCLSISRVSLEGRNADSLHRSVDRCTMPAVVVQDADMQTRKEVRAYRSYNAHYSIRLWC